MARNLEYKVVDAKEPVEFSNTVTKMLGEGWQLYGDPFIIQGPPGGSTTMFYQALTRLKEAQPGAATTKFA